MASGPPVEQTTAPSMTSILNAQLRPNVLAPLPVPLPVPLSVPLPVPPPQAAPLIGAPTLLNTPLTNSLPTNFPGINIFLENRNFSGIDSKILKLFRIRKKFLKTDFSRLSLLYSFAKASVKKMFYNYAQNIVFISGMNY